MTTNTHTFKAQALIRAIEAIAAAGGSDAREARLVGENLVTANLTGHDSHGVGMIPRYVESLLEGGLAAQPAPGDEVRRRRADRARRPGRATDR